METIMNHCIMKRCATPWNREQIREQYVQAYKTLCNRVLWGWISKAQAASIMIRLRQAMIYRWMYS